MVQQLAWHETLELHELVASQSIILMKLKKTIGKIADNDLRDIYSFAIRSIEQNLRELMNFYPHAPMFERETEYRNVSKLYAGDLLLAAKTSVRNYAIAITETATPSLRNVLVKQLNGAIKLHERIFIYMYRKGNYPSYNLTQLLHNDLALAKQALSLPSRL